MSDLTAQILAAIEAKEAKARAATKGPWTVDDVENAIDGGWRINGDELASQGPPPRQTEVAGWGYDGGGIWVETDARFIVDNDPTSVLRRCAADRRMVGRHFPEQRSGYRPDDDDTPGAYGRIKQACAECGSQDLAVRWPCPTLRDLAEGYGITVKQEAS